MLDAPGRSEGTRGSTMRASAGNHRYPQFDASPLTEAGSDASDRLVRAMRTVLASQRPESAAEALRLLRRGYPDIPLAVRIAAMCAGAK
jgi:hypothetical protein